MRELTPRRVLVARMLAQGMAGRRAGTVVDAVRRVVALQSQDVAACRLSVRARSTGLTRSDVDSAVAGRSVVRTWAMRGTLHMLAARDAGWVVGLLGPHFARRSAGRRRQLGLTEEVCERGVLALREVLADGPLTRHQLVAGIAELGVVIDRRSQAPAHLLAYAALRGAIVRGPDLDKDEPTYELAEPAALPKQEALARLAAGYLAGFGPASAQDFAAWSGLPVTSARTGLDAVAGPRVTVAGQECYLLDREPPAPPGRHVRLVGHFDTYLLGYRGRALAVPEEFARRVRTGGFVMPAVLVDGAVVGTWRQRVRRDRLTVLVEPFTTLPRGRLPSIRDEVDDLGRFLGVPAELAGTG